ncbi:hypothetical protein Cpa01nite_18340 [Cellulomonas pakistanensis]|uniref:SseB protein N-terminal domain-containing protein n=1 Tax=Cellulomonas pakistanensis TaxID=992287 RepID=A0A919PB77_9CELL|nr:hypothetical protein Cpa01nite_18340 [Cellulomonas pakistanensis]
MVEVETPPVVYLACLAHHGSDPRAMVLGMDDGRRALLAYSSLDRLQRYAGPDQAWALVSRDDLATVAAHDVLLLDARVPGREPEPRSARPVVGPAVYLPVRIDGDSVEVRTLKDGRRALLAYSALDRLAEHCGPAQRWILVETAQLGLVKQRQPFDVVITDMHVPEQYRREGRIA